VVSVYVHRIYALSVAVTKESMCVVSVAVKVWSVLS